MTYPAPGTLPMRLLALAVALLAVASGPAARAQRSPTGQPQLSEGMPEPSEGGAILGAIGFDQNLDAQVPLDVALRDESDREVVLGQYFGERPVVLTLVYYSCPTLCNQVLNGLVRSLRPLSLELGEDFDVVTVSIDPNDTPYLASRKKAAYLEEYGRPGAEAGWHFLTGAEAEVRRLAETVGFRYSYNREQNLYAHAAGLVVLTPTGRVSRYLYGIDFPPRDLQFSVMESSTGKIGSPIRQVLLFCYDYDAASGKYTLSIVRLLQVLGIATASGLGLSVLLMLRWERRRQSRQARPPAPDDTPVGAGPA